MSIPFNPDWRVAPGETIKDVLAERNLRRSAVAQQLGMTPGVFRALLDGITAIDADLAARLEAAFGIKAQFWLNLEAAYRRPL